VRIHPERPADLAGHVTNLRKTTPPQLDRQQVWLRVDVTAKTILVVLLLFAATHTDWHRFSDKAMVGRAVLYPVMLAVLPLAWWLLCRHRRSHGEATPEYPALAASVMTVPFLVDMAGNALDMYDRVDHFDDVCHFVNWAFLCAAVGLLLQSRRVPGWAIAGLCAGFGASTAIVWEIAEYLTFVPNGPEATGAYRDTIGDLALGLSGSIIAGGLVGLKRRTGTPQVLTRRTPPSNGG
jgi:hypothetical protein